MHVSYGRHLGLIWQTKAGCAGCAVDWQLCQSTVTLQLTVILGSHAITSAATITGGTPKGERGGER